MAEEELGSYKDISELKRDLEGMKGKKEVSTRELFDAVQKLSQRMTDILEIFGAAADQMKLEEKEAAFESKRHETIISKLDKILDQNKTIAEGMVSLVELVNRNIEEPEHEDIPKPKEDTFFRPRPEPQQTAQPSMMPSMAPPQMMAMPPQMPMSFAPSVQPPDAGMQMPPMEPAPSPDLDFPEEPFELGEPKKKGLFGMFKK